MDAMRHTLPIILLLSLSACDLPRGGTAAPKPTQPPAPTVVRGNGIADCGPSGNDNCASSILVAGGTFFRGTTTSNPATVSDFRLDKYEVTVGRFRKFVDAWVGGWRPSAGAGKRSSLPGSGWDASWNSRLASSAQEWNTNLRCGSVTNWTETPDVNELRPINCLSWYDIAAFCTWDGGFLPTEAEWEYAAAGGSEERTFPWGNVDPSSSLAVSKASSTSNVGMFPGGNGRWGHSDMSGNVWEWTLDWYHDAYKTPCNDCANLDPSPARVIRGGSFYRNEVSLAAAYRYSFDPVTRNDGYGGRCARTP